MKKRMRNKKTFFYFKSALFALCVYELLGDNCTTRRRACQRFSVLESLHEELETCELIHLIAEFQQRLPQLPAGDFSLCENGIDLGKKERNTMRGGGRKDRREPSSSYLSHFITECRVSKRIVIKLSSCL
jgi:hypothetical protein